MTYLDTSALVKRFVAEAGSSKVQSLLTGRAPIASATIAYAELYVTETNNSFPSGHSMGSMIGYGMVAYTAARWVPRRRPPSRTRSCIPASRDGIGKGSSRNSSTGWRAGMSRGIGWRSSR